jgi:hypothetical protein
MNNILLKDQLPAQKIFSKLGTKKIKCQSHPKIKNTVLETVPNTGPRIFVSRSHPKTGNKKI